MESTPAVGAARQFQQSCLSCPAQNNPVSQTHSGSDQCSVRSTMLSKRGLYESLLDMGVIAGEIYRILYMGKLRYLLYNPIYNDLECIFGFSVKCCSESVMVSTS